MTAAGNSTTPKMRMRAGPIHGSEARNSRPPRRGFAAPPLFSPPERGRPSAAPASGIDDTSVVVLMVRWSPIPPGG